MAPTAAPSQLTFAAKVRLLKDIHALYHHWYLEAQTSDQSLHFGRVCDAPEDRVMGMQSMANFVDRFLWRNQEISFLIKNAFFKEESDLVTTAQEVVRVALSLKLLILLGGKFCPAVQRDVHLSYNLTDPLLHDHTLVCCEESFQQQKPVLLELLEL